MKVNDFRKVIGANFYTGVPDSLLSVLCDSLIREYGDDMTHHVIAANEGNAVALAAGYHLATGKVGVVYMQNSGEGNAVNPICSLLHPDVYGIPCLFVIGWRGEPGKKDEPQHVYQGKVTHQQMEVLGIKCFTLTSETTVDELKKALTEFKDIFSRGQSAAIVVSKGALTSDESPLKFNNNCTLKREQALELILNNTSKETVFVSTTGKTSRELFELREKLVNFTDKSNNTESNNSTLKNRIHEQDFLTVGSMGHASSIALGIALQMPDKQIFCIDGDGAALMHMGAMATIGQSRVKNYVHIVINNGAHESVGGFPTTSTKVDFVSTAKNYGYRKIWSVTSETELITALKEIGSDSSKKTQSGAYFLEIKCSQGSRSDLGRPTLTAEQNKLNFMKMLQK